MVLEHTPILKKKNSNPDNATRNTKSSSNKQTVTFDLPLDTQLSSQSSDEESPKKQSDSESSSPSSSDNAEPIDVDKEVPEASNSAETEKQVELNADTADDKKEVENSKEEKGKEADEEEDDDGEYVVEAILNHRPSFRKGWGYDYYIKWESYDDPNDNTWTHEQNCAGCQDMIDQYWKKRGGRPDPFPPKNSSTKRRRSSSLLTTSRRSSTLASPKTSKTSKRRRLSNERTKKTTPPRTRSSSALIKSFSSSSSDSEDDFKPPTRRKSWEDMVERVEAIERLQNGKLIVRLKWTNGHSSLHDNVVVYGKCPMKVLSYYEQHSSFD
ncbi:chromodomain protein 2 [Schizosaccharomyces japonicus yFS275]|uniref:Chromodomain protein 2 n=1 Tax=Schizosaccharomyces japonicus (strain yFS275 / FY16936) TaxID=402676 RepID=B6JYB8_SCHJY|nr:chromodomain protein 2 [Schizosaccharomyces japonicus yFS275]EEB06536.1 chromodomain protein 2 [Schizosaccharomyces japonicus yFS275]